MRMRCVLLASLLLVACTPPEPPLRVGLLEWPPYAIAWLAVDDPALDEHGVEFVEFQSPAEARRAYLVGGIDIVALTFDYLVELSDRSDDHRALIVIDESLGGDAAISRQPVEELGDIRGLRVGIEASELGAFFASRLLDEAGLAPRDIVPVFVDFPDQLAAWDAGDVDVLLTWEPTRTELLERGGHEIFSSADIPGEIIDVFIARKDLLERRPQHVRAFAAAWFRALERFAADPAAAAEILAPRLRLEPEEFLRAIDGTGLFTLRDNHRVLGGGDAEFLATLGRVVESESLRNRGVTGATLPRLFTPAALPPRADGDR